MGLASSHCTPLSIVSHRFLADLSNVVAFGHTWFTRHLAGESLKVCKLPHMKRRFMSTSRHKKDLQGPQVECKTCIDVIAMQYCAV